MLTEKEEKQVVNQPNINKPKFMSCAQLGNKLGISRIAAYKQVKKGKIEAYRIGRSFAIPENYKVYKIKRNWVLTKLEVKVKEILDKISPNKFSFVGDFKFGIEKFYPDFVRMDNKKQIIECFGDFWHKNKQKKDTKRIETYKKYGYKVLVIWEKEFKNEIEVFNKICDFVNQ